MIEFDIFGAALAKPHAVVPKAKIVVLIDKMNAWILRCFVLADILIDQTNIRMP